MSGNGGIYLNDDEIVDQLKAGKQLTSDQITLVAAALEEFDLQLGDPMNHETMEEVYPKAFALAMQYFNSPAQVEYRKTHWK